MPFVRYLTHAGGALLGQLCVAALLLAAGLAQAEPVKVVLDWAWLPYHSPFLIAEARGYYRDVGLEPDIQQGRGSATTAMLLAQGGFDIAHLNVTNAAQLIGKGAAIKVVAIYQHRSGASFVGIKGHVKLASPQALIGLKIGSTPGGSDGLSLKIFTRANNLQASQLDIVSLDAQAKTAALFGGRIDVVSGDSPAYDAYVRATDQQPETLMLADYGVPLLGFGFAVNNDFLKAHADVVRKFLAATRRGFADVAKDPKAACAFMRTAVHLAGSDDRCVDYVTGLLALSTAPDDANWGRQSETEWQQLLATLRAVGELDSDRPPGEFYTNAYLAP